MARMLLSVVSGCLALLLAGGSIVFLGWLLWWLWSRQRREEDAPAEIELDAPVAGQGAVVLPAPELAVRWPEPEVPESSLPEPVVSEVVLAPAEEYEVPPPEPLAEPERWTAGERGAVVVDMQAPRAIPLGDIEGPGGPDDLLIIEGIGPRCAAVLRAAGIHTFRQLADAEISRLEEILRVADPRLARLCKPNTWPEQAALAAAGDWEAFRALTDTLKGGRHV